MNMLVPQDSWTAEDFLRLPDSSGFELVDGKLVEMNMGAASSYTGGLLFWLLAGFCNNPFRGWVFPADTSYQILPGRANVVRKPDVSFIRRGRLPNETVPEGHLRVAPDLVAEVVSPNDLFYEVEEKVAEYRSAGVPLVWIICPPTKTVLIRRLDGTSSEVGENGDLDGEQVVPGFRCRVADLFPSPIPPATAP